MAAVGYIQKTGKNDAQNYKYATEADVAEMMRDELAKRQVFIFPSLVSCSRTRVERPGYPAKQLDGSMKDTVKVSYATDLVMRWTFCDGESGETMECDIPGCSETPGDKGVYVAMTGSEKYLLMKAFLIPTGDDPESNDNEPGGTKEDAQAVAARKLAEHAAKMPVAQPGDLQATPIAKTELRPANADHLVKERVYEGLEARRKTPPMAEIGTITMRKGPKAEFWVVKWNGGEWSTFDSVIVNHLEKGRAEKQQASIYTSEKSNPRRPNQPYRNIDGLHRVGNTFFEDDGKTPIKEISEADFNLDAAELDELPL